MWAFIIFKQLVWLLSRAVTLAALLGATPCQVQFGDTVSCNPSTGWVWARQKIREEKEGQTGMARKTSWKKRRDWWWHSGAAVVSCERPLLPRRPDLKCLKVVPLMLSQQHNWGLGLTLSSEIAQITLFKHIEVGQNLFLHQLKPFFLPLKWCSTETFLLYNK